MPQNVRLTLPVARVLARFLADPTRPQYGYQLMRATRLSSATIYLLLGRLEAAGWITADRETDRQDAPPRTYYLLTEHGLRLAREAIADLVAELGGRPSPAGFPSDASLQCEPG